LRTAIVAPLTAYRGLGKAPGKQSLGIYSEMNSNKVKREIVMESALPDTWKAHGNDVKRSAV